MSHARVLVQAACSSDPRPALAPARAGSTMKLAEATCAPGPGRFAYMLAVPMIAPDS